MTSVTLSKPKTGPAGCHIPNYYFREPLAWITEQECAITSYDICQEDLDVKLILEFEKPHEALLFKLTWGGK